MRQSNLKSHVLVLPRFKVCLTGKKRNSIKQVHDQGVNMTTHNCTEERQSVLALSRLRCRSVRTPFGASCPSSPVRSTTSCINPSQQQKSPANATHFDWIKTIRKIRDDHVTPLRVNNKYTYKFHRLLYLQSYKATRVYDVSRDKRLNCYYNRIPTTRETSVKANKYVL